jgi:mannose-6-phosphate isomerase-like protein (cupin superfamily)
LETPERRVKVVQKEQGEHFNPMGAKMTYKATFEDTAGAYSLAVETTPPGGGLPLHVHHNEDEAMYILGGEYEIQCGNQLIRATSGTFVFLPRDVPNKYRNITDLPATFLYITSPGGFERFIEQVDLMAKSGSPDMEKMVKAAREHGIEYL